MEMEIAIYIIYKCTYNKPKRLNKQTKIKIIYYKKSELGVLNYLKA